MLKVILYDGERIFQTKDITIGSTSIRFDKLNPNTNYEYAIVTVIDLLDGNNKNIHVLHNGDFITNSLFTLNLVTSTQDSITFEINVTDVDEVGSITAIELYKGETLVEALTDLSLRTFTNLLSNNEYQVKVTYTYDLNDGVGEQTLVITKDSTTQAKATPIVLIENAVSTQDSITFEINVTDVDEVGSITAIELYKGETLVEALTDLSLRTFTNLLSNNEYQVKVFYTYDLNDGVGEQTLVITKDSTTQAKATPIVLIENVVSTQDSITFEINVTDVDAVGSITAIELYKGETLVEALNDLSLRTFTKLQSNTEYRIKVDYTYNLQDGNDNHIIITNTEKYMSYLDILNDYTMEGYFWAEIIDITTYGLIISNPIEGHSHPHNISIIFEDSYDFSELNIGDIITLYGKHSAGDILGIFDTLKVRDKEFMGTIKTKAITPTITSYEIITGELSQSEESIIRLYIENPDSIMPAYVVINQNSYKIDSISTFDMLQFRYIPTSSGKIELNVENYIMEDNTKLILDDYYTIYVNVMGIITVLDFHPSSGKEYLMYNDSITISLLNPDAYKVIGLVIYTDRLIQLNENQITYVDSNTFMFNLEMPISSSQTIEIQNIMFYTNDSESEVSTKLVNLSKKYTIVNTIVEISNPQELIAIDGRIGTAYILINDIDLRGFNNFYGIDYLFGVIDGNGFTIRNLFLTINSAIQNDSFGLIKRNYGTLCNVSIDNFYYIIKETSKQTYVGLAASENYGIIVDIDVNGSIEFIPSENHISFVASIVGLNVGGDIINNFSKGNILIYGNGYVNTGSITAGSNVGGRIENNESEVSIFYN